MFLASAAPNYGWFRLVGKPPVWGANLQVSSTLKLQFWGVFLELHKSKAKLAAFWYVQFRFRALLKSCQVLVLQRLVVTIGEDIAKVAPKGRFLVVS